MERNDNLPIGPSKEQGYRTLETDIASKILIIRNVQVILDRDLALLYDVKPRRLREQVKRNKARFPPEFMFQLDDTEVDFLVSQNATPSKKHFGGTNPYVFTEQGVAMLSAVLRSDAAIIMSIEIMKVFVALRHFVNENATLFHRIDSIEFKQDEMDRKITTLFQEMNKGPPLPKQGIFFNGQIFDAYQFLSDLIRSANDSIIIMDNYIDDSVLVHFTKKKKDVVIIVLTKNITPKLKLDVKKFNLQYPRIELKRFDPSHDRFLIIDKIMVYHFGASLKDLGKRWFAFSKMELGTIEILSKLDELKIDD